ncbi:HET-domain-containing protein [Daldinia caldariorum]|uniref:HET-domain-containing protein n=1 Tax=Daldinia caldariorum TaxID=326644 RepID=UPI002008AF8B|nr:HET-domain-containing protein [Daldinia caldariorum]KAI1472761.1 HET-domain-containing protein [Daldinia caldariorum]
MDRIRSKYEYTPLDPTSQDIRLVTILPGKFDDPFQIKITHAPLFLLPPPVLEDKPARWPLDAIWRSLPQAWNARETLEGRVVFRNYDARYSSWDHPDPGFPRERYEVPPDADGRPSVDFEALSYTWGSPKIREKAIVVIAGEAEDAGKSGGGGGGGGFSRALGRGTGGGAQKIGIQGNLADAMRHLRYEDRSRVVWIDALCINQDDLEERGEQVKRMGLIYALARRVVAWLGPGSARSELAFARLAHLGRQIEHARDGTMFAAPGCAEGMWYSPRTALPWDADTWEAVFETCSRGWFGRLWIVQEMHLGRGGASVLQCGRGEIAWALFRRAVICVHAKQVGVPAKLWHKTQEIKFLCEHLADMPFADLLKNHHKRPCQDDRDKVYGLLSLAPPEISRHVSPDYGASRLEVYRSVFFALVKHERRLSLLPYSGQQYSSTSSSSSSSSSSFFTSTTKAATEEWPTWLPDWTRLVRVTSPHHVGFCASGASSCSGAKYVGPGRLQVAALYFASTSGVGAKLAVSDFADFRRAGKKLGLDRERGAAAPYPSRGTYRDAWLETLALGRVEDRHYGIGCPSLESLAAMVAAPEGTVSKEEKALSDGWKIWTTGRIDGCYLFSTQNGYVGMINGEPQQGDEIFVVLGCNMPMLLRPTASGEYEVIGDCYVQGIMDGEALFGSIPPPWTVQIGADADNRVRAWYYNEETAAIYRDHQRLQEVPLPLGWEEVKEWERTRADPLYCRRFHNKETGETINWDPRLSPEEFRGRGVPIETITLV